MQTHPTVALTREHVAAMRDHIEKEIYAADDLRFNLERGERDEAYARLQCVTVCLRLLDQIAGATTVASATNSSSTRMSRGS